MSIALDFLVLFSLVLFPFEYGVAECIYRWFSMSINNKCTLYVRKNISMRYFSEHKEYICYLWTF